MPSTPSAYLIPNAGIHSYDSTNCSDVSAKSNLTVVSIPAVATMTVVARAICFVRSSFVLGATAIARAPRSGSKPMIVSVVIV